MWKLSKHTYGRLGLAGRLTLVMVLALTLASIAIPAQAQSGPGFALTESRKVASQPVVATGDVLTYTIELVNSGAEDLPVWVADPIPEPFAYVAGSASHNGKYMADRATLTWDVTVGARSTLPLTFQVTAGEVAAAIEVSNVAAISSVYQRFVRTARVTVVPAGSSPPEPAPQLAASLKVASPRVVAIGGAVTYTIYLINSGTADALADVVDPLPEAMAYVAGSASPTAAYDPAAHTLSWTDVLVRSGEAVELVFQATAQAVATPAVVVNTATISAGDLTYQRSARAVIVPVPPGTDVVPPRLVELRIGDSDVLADPNVQLHITAEDDSGVSRMKIAEWTLTSGRAPRWRLVRMTDWIPFAAEYPWQLSAESGTHFVGVWLADGARNASAMTRRAIDFASLLLPNTTVGQDEAVAYLVNYQAGTEVTASLTTHSGDADLYVWFPGNHRLPDLVSNQEGTAPDAVSFTAPATGVYLFVVYGQAESVYDLDIDSGHSGTAIAANGVAPSAKPGLQADPALTWSGVLPLGPESTPQPHSMQLPLILLR